MGFAVNFAVRLKLLIGLLALASTVQTCGLQIRFQQTAEYHSCSFCAQIEPLQFAEYHQNMRLFIVVDVTVDVKRGLKCISPSN